MDRRNLLQALTCLGLTSLLQACRRPLRPLCTEPPGVPPRLTIDVHAHVFNGTDLPVKDYVDLVVRNNQGTLGQLAALFGGILEEIVWTTAPDPAAERSALSKLSGPHPLCPSDQVAPPVLLAQEHAYTKARQELRRAAAKRKALLKSGAQLFTFPEEEAGFAAVEALPPTYHEFHNPASRQFSLLQQSAGSLIDFVTEMFQYRFTSYARYLNDFYQSSGRRVDLTVAALVDYDWWLSNGASTPTQLPDQAALMADLVVASAGRLHYWAPFCPYRQAQYRTHPHSTFSSLELVQTAVRKGGAIGVKIYPPMGFAPFGNQNLDPHTWSVPWLRGLPHQAHFGYELDVSMKQLYDWCVAEDVPILAHANTSSGPSQAFSNLAGPQYWQAALQTHPNLRVIFGHFGGAEDPQAANKARTFVQLMGAASGSLGSRASADVAYFSKALDDPSDLISALAPLFSANDDPAGVLPHRLLFGSDWKMLLLEQHANEYLQKFATVLTTMAQPRPAGLGLPNLVEDTLGRNAITALGLQAGQATRTRIETFYKSKGVQRPLWMRAVDGHV